MDGASVGEELGVRFWTHLKYLFDIQVEMAVGSGLLVWSLGERPGLMM